VIFQRCPPPPPPLILSLSLEGVLSVCLSACPQVVCHPKLLLVDTQTLNCKPKFYTLPSTHFTLQPKTLKKKNLRKRTHTPYTLSKAHSRVLGLVFTKRYTLSQAHIPPVGFWGDVDRYYCRVSRY